MSEQTTPETTATADPWADLPSAPEHTFDGHDDGHPLTPQELDDLVEAESASGAIVRAGEDLLLASPDRLREVARAVASGLSARLTAIAREAATHRGSVGKPTASHLTHEFHALSRAHAVLGELERVFADLKRQAAGHAADAAEDHLGRKRVDVNTPDGGLVTVETKSPTSKLSVVEEQLLDVLATATFLDTSNESYTADQHAAHAAGVRAGIAALRKLGTPSWKSTALEGLVAELQRAGEPDLAARLEQSFARVASGEPKTTLTIKYPDPSSTD